MHTTPRFVVAVSLLSLACIMHTSSSQDGSAVFDWSVHGTARPSQCYETGAAYFSVTLYDERSRALGTYDARCDAFATTVPLLPGRYTADAVLTDSSRGPRTTTILVSSFDIYGGESVTIAVDFPPDSFY